MNLVIPDRFSEKLAQNSKLKSAVEMSISNFQSWINDNKLVFFPEYTDHGMNHLQEVLDSAQGLISESSWDAISAEDIAAIVLSILLHDCALHLSEDGFYELINDEYPKISSRYVDDQESWRIIWNKFLEEAKRFDDDRLISLFGKKVIVNEVPNDKGELTLNHRLLIGEFLRRHHARLAHEIAFNGIPNGISHGEKIKLASTLNYRFYDLVGFIAKSHNLSLRNAVDRLSKNSKQSDQGIHVPFVMAVLRIADYIQIHSDRAPSDLLKVKKLISPISRGEWNKHHSIDQIHNNHDDPEAIFIDAEPLDAVTYESLINLFTNIQKELDVSWSILGEIYGRYRNLNFGLNIRRIRSSLDNKNDFIKEKKINNIPEVFRFRTAHTQLMELLIKPLYGNRPEIGVRELLQNSVDAVKERMCLVDKGIIPKENEQIKVTLTLEKDNDQYFFIVRDDGIGMSKEIIRDYFLNVGASFRHSDIWKDQYMQSGKTRVSRIGRFGVGVLAAYLLGNKITVKTRSIFEDQGLSFKCENVHAPIQIHKINMDVGTVVKVEIDQSVYNYLLKNYKKWDWYLLQDIIVEKNHVINGEKKFLKKTIHIDESKFELLKSNSSINVKFAFLRFPNYNFYSDHKEPILLCNGIRIENYSSYERNLEINKDSDFLLLNKPSILVDDKEGVFPLDLQRDNLLGNPDFSDDLRNQIYRNIVNNLKLENSEIIEKIQCVNDNVYLYGENKKYIFDPSILKSVGMQKLIYFISHKNVFEKFDLTLKNICDSDFLYTSYYIDSTKSANVAFLRSVFLNDDRSYYDMSFSRISTKSKKITLIMRKNEVKDYVGKGNYPPTYWDSLYKEEIDEKWILVSNKNISDESSAFNYKKIVAYLNINFCKYFLAYDFDWDKETMELTDFAKIYQREYPDFNLI